MAQTIVNLTLPVITHKVKEVLEETAQSSAQPPAPSTALQEKLVTYVLRRMPTFYVTTEKSKPGSLDSPISCFSPAQQDQMDDLIQEGLQHLMARRSSWEITAQESTSGFGSSPSHWFG